MHQIPMTAAWYPVVFPDRCDGCKGFEGPRCIEFCPHDVFNLVDNKAVVVNPQNCINGCIACMPLCPRKAIEFPERSTFREEEKVWTKSLRKATCRKCGKVFWTNDDKELCWECSSSS